MDYYLVDTLPKLRVVSENPGMVWVGKDLKDQKSNPKIYSYLTYLAETSVYMISKHHLDGWVNPTPESESPTWG